MMHYFLLNVLVICALCPCVASSSIRLSKNPGLCQQLSDCSCQMDNGGIIDISSLGKRDGTPLFHDVQSTDGYVYSYNPCGGFSEGVCSNAAVCKKDQLSRESLMIGRAVGTEFSYDEQTDQIVVVYTAGQLGELHTIAYLLCEQSSRPGPPQFFPNGTMDTNLFLITLYSVCACPGGCDANGVIGRKSLLIGVGWIVCICVGGLFVLYFLVGTLFMKFVKKASGTDVIPNKSFWVNLPHNVKTGSVFLFYKCTCKKENYSDMK